MHVFLAPLRLVERRQGGPTYKLVAHPLKQAQRTNPMNIIIYAMLKIIPLLTLTVVST